MAAIKSKFTFKIIFRIISFTSIVLLIGLCCRGREYYMMPLQERPRHADYASLKPGGMAGHGFGVIGGSMILLTFCYTARKRWKPLKKVGTIPQWLDIHIYFGLMGPALVVLHTSFKINGLIAIAFWAMIAVVLSGFVGRFLIRQIPRNIKGRKLSLSEIQERQQNLREQLHRDYGISDTTLKAIEMTAMQGIHIKMKFPEFVTRVLAGNLSCRYRIRHILNAVNEQGISTLELHQLYRLSCEEAILTRNIQLLKTSQNFFKHWHRIHKPFTTVLIVIMFIHIAVSLLLGYRWIF